MKFSMEVLKNGRVVNTDTMVMNYRFGHSGNGAITWEVNITVDDHNTIGEELGLATVMVLAPHEDGKKGHVNSVILKYQDWEEIHTVLMMAKRGDRSVFRRMSPARPANGYAVNPQY